MRDATALAQGLRAAADWFERHPEYCPFQLIVFNLFADDRAELAELRRALGRVEKSESGPWFVLEKDLGGGVKIDANIRREQVCRRVVRGVRHVEARVIEAHDEEIVEWVCEEPILAGAK